MSSHTPGPWMWNGDDDLSTALINDVGAQVLAIDLPEFIHPEDKRVIAAAPELLTGCKALLAIYDELAGGCGYPGVREARAAIAKAEGAK